jgi:hypothetical protein
VRLDAERAETLEEADAVDRAARTGDPDDQA